MSFTIPSRLNTELDAVNIVLTARALAPVNTIDPTDPDVSAALMELNKADLEVQSREWFFNSDEALTLIPDAVSKEIVLPYEVLSVCNSEWPSFNGGKPCRVVNRDGKLYDHTNGTFQWENSIKVDIVVRLPYEELPQQARAYIAILAGHRAQATSQNSPVAFKINQDQVTSALVQLEWLEDKHNPQNQVTNLKNSVLGTMFASGVRRRINWQYDK